jgi:putative heme iron utilization protein
MAAPDREGESMDPQLLETVAGVVHGCRWAALATVGRGVPLATQVAWVADADLCGGLLLLSRLSAHTRNLLAESRASLSLGEADDGREDPQTLARVTLDGHAVPLARDADGWATARERYLARLPAAAQWFDFGDFSLFVFTVERARYVGGFANAHTLRRADLLAAADAGR